MVLSTFIRLPGLAALACAALALGAVPAHADYPDQPIRIVVPYPAGGSVDALARMMGQKMGDSVKQTFIVENRPGAGSNIGANYVAHAKPDGYTLLLGTSAALAVNISLYPTMTYDPAKDFRPIVLGAKLPSFVLVSSQQQQTKTMQELNAFLKKNDGEGTFYASSGAGTPSHLGAELYKRALGLKSVHVPYKGGAPALADMAANRANFMVAIVPESLALIQEGMLRPLAVTSDKRLAAYPDLPTVAESGVPGYEVQAWYALVAPAGTPDAVVAKLNQAYNDMLKDPQMQEKLKAMGFIPGGGTPQELSALMASETVKWRQVIKDANIKVE